MMVPHLGLRVFPWRNWKEWQWVMNCFFENDLNKKRKGIERVVTWRLRGHVPHAVDATCQIVEASLHLSLSAQGAPQYGQAPRSPDELRALISLAVVRALNGLVDAKQKGQFALPVSKLAKRIGLPVWLVDLRHEATHGELPSLATLKLSIDFLLGYLHTNYWAPQKEHLEFLKSAYKRLLKQYTQSKKQEDIDRITSGLTSSLLGDFILPLLMDPEANLMIPGHANEDYDWHERLSLFLPLLSELQMLCSGVSVALVYLCFYLISRGIEGVESIAKRIGLKWMDFFLSWQWHTTALKELPCQDFDADISTTWQALKKGSAKNDGNSTLAITDPAPFALQVLLGHPLHILARDCAELVNTANDQYLESFYSKLKNVEGLDRTVVEVEPHNKEAEETQRKAVPGPAQPADTSSKKAMPSLEEMESLLGIAKPGANDSAWSPKRQRIQRGEAEDQLTGLKPPGKCKGGNVQERQKQTSSGAWQIQSSNVAKVDLGLCGLGFVHPRNSLMLEPHQVCFL